MIFTIFSIILGHIWSLPLVPSLVAHYLTYTKSTRIPQFAMLRRSTRIVAKLAAPTTAQVAPTIIATTSVKRAASSKVTRAKPQRNRKAAPKQDKAEWLRTPPSDLTFEGLSTTALQWVLEYAQASAFPASGLSPSPIYTDWRFP